MGQTMHSASFRVSIHIIIIPQALFDLVSVEYFILTRQKLIFLVVQVNNLADYLHEARASLIPVFFFNLEYAKFCRTCHRK